MEAKKKKKEHLEKQMETSGPPTAGGLRVSTQHPVTPWGCPEKNCAWLENREQGLEEVSTYFNIMGNRFAFFL